MYLIIRKISENHVFDSQMQRLSVKYLDFLIFVLNLASFAEVFWKLPWLG